MQLPNVGTNVQQNATPVTSPRVVVNRCAGKFQVNSTTFFAAANMATQIVIANPNRVALYIGGSPKSWRIDTVPFAAFGDSHGIDVALGAINLFKFTSETDLPAAQADWYASIAINEWVTVIEVVAQ